MAEGTKCLVFTVYKATDVNYCLLVTGAGGAKVTFFKYNNLLSKHQYDTTDIK